MNHVDWINTDNIIICSSTNTDFHRFLSDCKNVEKARLLINDDNYYFIFVNDIFYSITSYSKKSNNYYISISKAKHTSDLKKAYLKFERNNKINKILK